MQQVEHKKRNKVETRPTKFGLRKITPVRRRAALKIQANQSQLFGLRQAEKPYAT
jgi:hypothetical protein